MIARMIALEDIPAGAAVTVDVRTGNIKLYESPPKTQHELAIELLELLSQRPLPPAAKAEILRRGFEEAGYRNECPVKPRFVHTDLTCPFCGGRAS